MSGEWEIDNLPNRLTVFRILLIPLIVICLLLSGDTPQWSFSVSKLAGQIAAFIFIIAAITDFLDGYIARKKKLVTVLGSFLDPVADKFLIVSSLLLLQDLGRVPVLIVVILVLREMYITALRLLAREKGLYIPVSSIAKWKTVTQMMAMPALMAWYPIFNIPLSILGMVMIYAAAILSCYSAVTYSMGLFGKFREKKEYSSKQFKLIPTHIFC